MIGEINRDTKGSRTIGNLGVGLRLNVIKIIDDRIGELKAERRKLGSDSKGAWTRKRKASGIFHRIQELEKLKRRLLME